MLTLLQLNLSLNLKHYLQLLTRNLEDFKYRYLSILASCVPNVCFSRTNEFSKHEHSLLNVTI